MYVHTLTAIAAAIDLCTKIEALLSDDLTCMVCMNIFQRVSALGARCSNIRTAITVRVRHSLSRT